VHLGPVVIVIVIGVAVRIGWAVLQTRRRSQQ
jgi:hypothetical protein